MAKTLLDKLNKFRFALNGCWVWTGTENNATHYGQFGLKEGSSTKTILAHRAMYEFVVGPIPKDMTLDHLCRNRLCVNPNHLEVVTRGENVLRGEGLAAQNAAKTACSKGHNYLPNNLYIDPRGKRECRTCRADATTRYQTRLNWLS